MAESSSSKRILVVEDDFLNRLFFCDVLADRGFEVDQVDDERQAVERVAAFAPDLIVMDIHMPHLSGVEIIKALKAQPLLAKIPVLAVTGYVGKGEEREVREAGAGGYLPKPVSMGALVRAVEDLLKRPRAS